MQSLNFWSSVRDGEVKLQSKLGREGGISALNEVYKWGIHAVVGRSAYPEDRIWWGLDEDGREEIHMYRRSVRDTLRVIIIGRGRASEEDFLSWIQSTLSSEIQNQGWTESKLPTLWMPCEALIHALSAVAKAVDVSEERFMPSLMSTLTQLPKGHAGTALTSVACIGVYASWLVQRSIAQRLT